MANFFIRQSNSFYGLSVSEFRKMIFDYAEANNIAHKFNRDTGLAGWTFYHNFLKRNPSVSLRQPEATSLNRIEAFNPDSVKLFYKNLSVMLDKHSFDANRIFNVDETGVTTVQRPGKILAPKGQKQVGSATSWERGKAIVFLFSNLKNNLSFSKLF